MSLANLMFADVGCQVRERQLGQCAYQIGDTDDGLRPFSDQPMRTRTAVFRERISHVFVPEMM
jgi:hypothetical protein